MGNEDLLADLGLTPEELEEVKNADLAQSRLDLEAAEARRRRIAERLAARRRAAWAQATTGKAAG